MKRIAFFIALMVGLNATPVVRKPEEEENQAIVQTDDNLRKKRNYTTIISTFTDKLVFYFYAITKEGRKDLIDWERISKIFKSQSPDNQNDDSLRKNSTLLNNRNNWLLLNYQFDGHKTSCELTLLSKK